MSARISLSLACGLLAMLGLAACDDVKSPTFIPALERIEVCRAPVAGCSAQACAGPGSATNAILPIGFEAQFCAVGFYQGLSNNDVTIAPPPPEDLTDSVIWASADSSRASVSATGLVRALAETPSVQITARQGDVDPGVALVRVSPAILESLEVDPPIVLRAVPGLITEFSCTGRFSGPPACPQVDPNSCDLTDTADWRSANENIYFINNTDNKGLGTAVSPGLGLVTCEQSTPSNGVVTSPASRIRVCSDVVLNSLNILPAGPLNLRVGQPRPLQLIGNFTANCGNGNETFPLDLTLSADWQSDRPDVVSVDNDPSDRTRGIAEGVAPGLARVTGSFGGQSAVIIISTINSEIIRLEVNGPSVVFPGFSVQLTATPFFRDAESGDLVAGEDVAMTQDILWRSLVPGALNFPDNDGLAVAAAEAQAQVVPVLATFQGVTSLPFALNIVDAELLDVQVNPGLGCISTAMEFLTGSAQRQFEANGVFSVAVPGQAEPVMCSLPVTERAEWRASDPEAFTGSGSDLLTILEILLPGGLVGGCQPLLPIAVSAGLTDSPALVSNAPGSKGLVTANPDALLPVLTATVGTGCIEASIGDLTGQGTVLVSIDPVPLVCSTIEILTDTLLADGTEAPSCAEVFAPPADEGDEPAAEGGGGGLLGGLLGGGS